MKKHDRPSNDEILKQNWYKEKIDVCIPTLNSGRTLDQCLKAVINFIPYKRIIICDGYSTDNTIKIAKEYRCKIFYSKGKLGEVRKKLMSLVKTEWFAFIDSDIVINKDWFRILTRFIDENTGGINGFGLSPSLLGIGRKYLLLLKLKLKIKQRGFLSNTLIRRDAIKGVKVSKYVGRGEDIVIQQEIEEKGWEWKFAPAFCLHLKSDTQIIREALGDLVRISNLIDSNPLRVLIRL